MEILVDAGLFGFRLCLLATNVRLDCKETGVAFWCRRGADIKRFVRMKRFNSAFRTI